MKSTNDPNQRSPLDDGGASIVSACESSALVAENVLCEIKGVDFKKAWEIYEASFPAEERRSFKKQLVAFQDSRYFFYLYRDQMKRVNAIFDGWVFEEFTFLEHLAVQKEDRSKGIGTTILRDFIQGRPLSVGEVELPEVSIQAQRRIHFYMTLGFKINDYDYVQPSYGEGKQPVAMKIISYPEYLSREQFDRLRATIYKEVYAVSPEEYHLLMHEGSSNVEKKIA